MSGRHREPSGQALVAVVLGIAVLVGVVGLAIDGGRLFLDRRRAQGAADQAALVVAQQFCSGASLSAAVAAGMASAATNGFDDGATNDVVIMTPESDRFRVRVATRADTVFIRLLGIGTFEAAATALTGCMQGGPSGPGAVYAGGTNCNGGKYAFDVSGSTSRVYGGVHANSDVNIGGANNRFTDNPSAPPDPFTYSQSLNPSLGVMLANGNTFEPGYPAYVLPPPPGGWAPGWDPSDVTPAMLQAYLDLAVANGTSYTNKVTTISGDGVYYTTSSEGMDIGGVTGNKNVVLVAPNGPIKVSSSNGTIRPYEHADLPRDGILMLSNMDKGTHKCDESTIDIAGGGNSWNGVLWAPRGQIQMSGSSSDSFNGSLVGWSVKLNGSDLTIFYDSMLFTGENSVLVLE